VNPHAEAGLREPQRRGAAGDAGADDRDVDPAVVAGLDAGRDGIFEPIRVQDVLR
jgi:hypothetical protein